MSDGSYMITHITKDYVDQEGEMIHFYHFDPRKNKIAKIGVFSYEDNERMLDYVIRPDTTRDKINAFYCAEDTQENCIKIHYISNDTPPPSKTKKVDDSFGEMSLFSGNDDDGLDSLAEKLKLDVNSKNNRSSRKPSIEGEVNQSLDI